MNLVDLITLSAAVSALILAITAKGDRPAQITATIAVVLAAVLFLESEIGFLDRLINRHLRSLLGGALLVCAITTAIRIKQPITTTVLITCSALLAAALWGIV